MPSRDLPARPSLEHLKHEAKSLRAAFARGDSAALDRVRAVLGNRQTLKLTEAQRVLAREYGFGSWSRLRAHVQAARGIDEAVAAFLERILNRDISGAEQVLRAQPSIVTASAHVAAVLGDEAALRIQLAHDPSVVRLRAGAVSGEPLLWLCHSPYHGRDGARDEGLAACARALLDAGADPNTRDSQYNVPALYAVTGVSNAPRIARMLLDAGAAVNDGESLFHAAEHYHVESLELLLEYGVDVNYVGDWGNTALYFLLGHWDVMTMPRVRQGLTWLLDHDADPDVRSGAEQETALHHAVRRRQHADVVRLLLQRGADVNAARADGRTPWQLAMRTGADDLAAVLEEHGAVRSDLSHADLLLGACGRGDTEAARNLSSAEIVGGLAAADLQMLPEAASAGRDAVVKAFLAAGVPVNATDAQGATALHHAAIRGNAELVQSLLQRGADFTIRDTEHDAPAIGWACFGADFMSAAGGDYEETVRALLHAGARHAADDHQPAHGGVRRVLQEMAG